MLLALPTIPDSWIQAMAAFGSIIVIILILRWTGKVLTNQHTQSEALIDRSFDIADRIVVAGVPSPPKEGTETTEPPEVSL